MTSRYLAPTFMICLMSYACTVAPLLNAAEPTAPFDSTHALFDQVLKRFVKDGFVDYTGLKSDPADLNRYLDNLAAVSESEFNGWIREEQIAYLVNLYNAQTLKLILDHYPLKSIKDIGNVLKGPWDQPVVRLFGDTVTLNRIEHQILRKKYDEPLVHFALVCAARGCPPLRSEVYRPDQLNEQFEDQGRVFMATSNKNLVDPAKKEISLSPIFKWFAEDFKKESGSVLSFVQPYFPGGTPQDLADGNYKVKYTYYDWSLNERKSGK